MRIFIAVVLITSFTSIAHAQNYHKVKAFINEIIATKYSADSIYLGGDFKSNHIYEDSIGRMAMNFMRNGMETAKNNVFYTFKNYGTYQTATDSLVLTVIEMGYINDEINKMTTHTWTKNLMQDFTFVLRDTITKAFAQRHFGRWKYFENKRIYNLGVPIFLRQDTYCFFYYGYGCGGECGEGYFYIYKKVKDKWERWLMLAGWMS